MKLIHSTGALLVLAEQTLPHPNLPTALQHLRFPATLLAKTDHAANSDMHATPMTSLESRSPACHRRPPQPTGAARQPPAPSLHLHLFVLVVLPLSTLLKLHSSSLAPAKVVKLPHTAKPAKPTHHVHGCWVQALASNFPGPIHSQPAPNSCTA